MSASLVPNKLPHELLMSYHQVWCLSATCAATSAEEHPQELQLGGNSGPVGPGHKLGFEQDIYPCNGLL